MNARRGFTALELALAVTLSSVVLLAAIGTLGYLQRADRSLGTRFEERSDLAIVHATVRRAMQSLVAKPEPPPNQPGSPVPPASGSNPEEDAIAFSDPEAEQKQKKVDEFNAILQRSRGVEERPERDRFILESQVAGRVDEAAPRRLEMVLLRPPTPGPAPVTPTVRGSFEVRPELDGYGLYWMPLIPAGEPVRLMGGIQAIAWRALAREQAENRFEAKSGAWRTTMSARSPGQFPKAVQLVLRTTAGVEADWVFEPAISMGPEP
ncbi:MAG: type II secretion system protein J [Phycisphaerales bacterium]